MAEPFRVLVVANFPANFTEAAARRLVSIATSGAALRRLHADQRRSPASRCRRASTCNDLEQHGVDARLGASERFVWQRPSFGSFPLTLDAPPAGEHVHRRSCTTSASRRKDASRVEVPFEFIAPPPSSWWTADSRHGHRRAARAAPARRKLQHAAARPRHVAARADRRQDRLRQIDAAARADHQPGAAATAPTRSSST